MMCPRRRCTIAFATARRMRKLASTLVRNIASQSSSVISSNGAYLSTPALFTKRSTSRAAAARSSAKPASLRSPASVCAGISFFSDSSSAARRPVAITLYPAFASATAQARPIPVLAPVINAAVVTRRLYPLALPLQHPVSQDVAPDLAGAGERQLAEVLEVLGQLVIGDLIPEELDDLRKLELGALLG